MEEIVKAWGAEHILVNEGYCVKFLKLNKKYRCSLHYHKKKDEVFYVIKGKILIEYSAPNLPLQRKSKVLKKGDYVRITPKMTHRFTGLRDSLILEASSHHDDDDSYRLTKSGRV